jgi:uncharacterized membrane protein YfcA
VSAFGMSMVVSSADRTAESLAFFVPVLFISDIGAVYSYRNHVKWSALNPLWIPCFFGIFAGMYCLKTLPEWELKKMSGLSLLILSVIYFFRKYSNLKSLPTHVHDDKKDFEQQRSSQNWRNIYLSGAFFGFLIGMFTVIANIAGPIAVVYFLQLGLPKEQLNGTRAWFFVIVNCVKIPAQIALGNLQFGQFQLLGLLIILGVLSTALSAEFIVPKVNQGLFEQLSWGFVIISAVKLLLF